MTRPNAPEDLWAKVDRSGGPKACWPFTGHRTSPGQHGRIAVRGRPVVASRVAWELTYGPVPAGLFVLHACDNPPCCNPGHLMLGSAMANSVDASRKGRMAKAVETHCKRGHPFAGNTYIHPTTGRRSCQECIRLRDKARPARPPKGLDHWAQPDGDGNCLHCGETLEYGSFGRGRSGWRHSRWAAA